ncbi:hypothetical protein [Mesobacillus zeae]|uniref:WXG100 family type VII secretion target n=1 Tax=Mesobacillus zeae TaxID=1917180 RepID=A0A398B4H5_9BACI|nr:hypothetical protein [Mesobacillus zeae]RID82666.1 hypothetical protein D1970_18200 [Mesobacillus zeae]
MASQNIKLNLDELESALSALKASISDFKSYTTNFRSGTRSQLKSFNSDFVDAVDDLLDNMNDDSNTKLLKHLDAIHDAGAMLVKQMKETDEKIGTKIRGGSK